MKSRWIATRFIKRWTVRFFFFFLVCAIVEHCLVLPIYFGNKQLRTPNYNALKNMVASYESRYGNSPKSAKDVDPVLAKSIAITTSDQYSGWRKRFHDMAYVERRPRRTLFPFPFGMWTTYATSNGEARRITSDLQTRRLCAFVAKQEAGGFCFFASFIPDLMIYAILARLAFLFFRREQRRKREAEETSVRFDRLTKLAFDFRKATSAFPLSARDLERVGASEEDVLSAERDCLFTGRLNAGIVLASAKDMRVPFAPGLRVRALAALDDGSVCRVCGTLAVDSFRDKLWTLERRDNVGKFYQDVGKLRFKRGTGYAEAFSPLILVWSLPLIPLIPIIVFFSELFVFWGICNAIPDSIGDSCGQIFFLFVPFIFYYTTCLTVVLFSFGIYSAFLRLRTGSLLRSKTTTRIGKKQERSLPNRWKRRMIFAFLSVGFIALFSAAAIFAPVVEHDFKWIFDGESLFFEFLPFLMLVGLPLPKSFYLLIARVLGLA